jgi:hypothetical protein
MFELDLFPVSRSHGFWRILRGINARKPTGSILIHMAHQKMQNEPPTFVDKSGFDRVGNRNRIGESRRIHPALSSN